MMKILLINPPRSPHNKILEYAPPEAKPFIHKKLIGPPLGLLTVAAALNDHDVDLLEIKAEYDLNPLAPPLEELVRQYLQKFRPDMVGVTFIASEFNAGITILRTVKEFDPGIWTVAGGLHVTLCPNDFVGTPTDVLIPGYSAQAIFRNLADSLDRGLHIEQVGGLLLPVNGMYQPTKAKPLTCNPAAEHFVMPRRSLIRPWLSTYIVGKAKGPATYLFTSLGCPYRCSFCSIWPQYSGQYLQRDVESVISELKTLDDYEVVRFADANSVVDVPWMDRLFDRIAEEDIKKSYVIDIRPDTVVENPKLIEKMARAGLIAAICGFESFRARELQKYNKPYAVENIAQAIDILHNQGIMVRGNYVIPADYEEADFQALTDYAHSHRVTYAGYTILSPMPGTTFYRQVKDQIIDFDLDKYNFFNCVLKTTLPLERFYENVGRLWLIKKGGDVI